MEVGPVRSWKEEREERMSHNPILTKMHGKMKKEQNTGLKENCGHEAMGQLEAVPRSVVTLAV